MARVPPEAAHPSGRIPGTAPPSRPIRSAGPRAEPAFKASSGASVNKVAAPIERQAFKSRPNGGGNTV